MKSIILIITFISLSIAFSSFRQDDGIGRIIFTQNCMSCHLPNKRTQAAPSFQNIRKDYGLKWTISFLRSQEKMLNDRDSRAVFAYYFFNKQIHVKYPVLEKEVIIKILDYVDSFPDEPKEYQHRKKSEKEKRDFVRTHLKDDGGQIKVPIYTPHYQADTVWTVIDTSQSDTIRKSYKRSTHKRQQ